MNKLVLFVVVCVFSGCIVVQNTDTTIVNSNDDTKTQYPKNIIFMVGDGMGVSQITAGLIANGMELELEKFPIVGLHKSFSSSSLITDSAAGATSFASGVKTYNGAIGVDADTVPVKTILEMAEDEGLATGLVATSSIVHATPASFIAHAKYRKQYELIAQQFLDTEVDLFIGGGKKFFERRKNDKRNLIDELKQKNYKVFDFINHEIDEVTADPAFNFAYFTADAEPLPFSQGRTYLPEASKLAVNFLDKRDERKGFFLVIEGSQIDWGGHAKKGDYIISEMLDFDKAVKEVLEFAEKDGNTLVVVTADHETGGYAINRGSTQDSIVSAFTSDYHTAAMIPVFAYGPGSDAFSGIYHNTEIFFKMLKAFRFDDKKAKD